MTAVTGARSPLATWELSALSRFPDWLAAVADPDRVRAELAPWMPDVVACDVVRVRIKADATTARYRVARASAARTATLVVDVRPPALGDSAPALRVVEEAGDSTLPALADLLEPEPAARLIERALGGPAGPYPGFRALSCAPTVTRYKPGSRCTVVYALGLPAGAPAAWPRGVVGKTYHAGKGAVAWAAMRELWRSPVRRDGRVALAEPLAFLAARRVLLQRVIPHERTLKEVLRSTLEQRASTAPLERLLDASARGLAALHRSGVPAAEGRSWEDELAEVRAVLARLAALAPAVDGAGGPLLRRLSAVAAAHPAQLAVPSHGSFRPAQVVVDAAGGIGFIDFDSFCHAEPALDVALFASALADSGLRALAGPDGRGATADDLERLDALCERFIGGYARAAPLDRARVELWWTLNALTGVLHCWTKVKADRLGYRIALLEHALRRVEAGP